MIIKNLIGGFLLASCLGLGVAAGISAHESKGVEEAKATGETLVGGQNVFLKVDNSNWSSAGAAFALYCFNSETDNAWAWFDSASSLSGSYSVAIVPDGSWANIIIVRMNPNGSDSSNNYLNWNNKWNQTGNIAVSANDTYTITGSAWDGATYEEALFSSKYSFNVSHSNETDGKWSTTTTVALTYRNDAEGAQFYSTNVSMSTGMLFDVVRSTDNAWFHSDYLENGGAVGTYFQKNGTNDASVIKGGTFEFYVKVKNDSVWTQVSSVTLAENYSDSFLQAITCTDSSTTFNLNVWNKVGEATTSMEYKYEQLAKGARDLLTGATFTVSVVGGVTTVTPTGTTTQKVANAVARYDRILAKYGYGDASGQYHDFMGRTPSPASANPFVRLTTEETVSYTGIAILAVLSVASISAYFLLKKKKHN